MKTTCDGLPRLNQHACDDVFDKTREDMSIDIEALFVDVSRQKDQVIY
jgi:hypothetical protein